ncbi:MAG: transcriptional regulator [Sulfitobacter sp.]|nr:transcriptional regulator [Sulfitobacter sp.]
MPIKHHLHEPTLLAYATGNLPEAVNLVVAAHVSLCDECRALAETFDTVGGALLEETAAVGLEQDSLDRALARIETEAPAPRAPVSPGTLPAPVQAYVGGDLSAVKWRPVGMGVKQALLPTSDTASARLLLIPAGAAIPDHSHSGQEFTLVLQGAFADEEDRFARGDIEIADDKVHHQPVADIGEDCICLAVTDAPLKFSGWLPRMVQRFVGI